MQQKIAGEQIRRRITLPSHAGDDVAEAVVLDAIAPFRRGEAPVLSAFPTDAPFVLGGPGMGGSGLGDQTPVGSAR